MHDALIAHGPPLGREALDEIAASIGVDMDRFRADLDRRRYRAAIVAETARAAAMGIRATPSLLINGRLVAGMPPAEMLAARIEGAREEAKAMVAAGIPRAQVLDALLKDATRVEP
jgi:predicted DsbA family dithiol-disulfide isomerase